MIEFLLNHWQIGVSICTLIFSAGALAMTVKIVWNDLRHLDIKLGGFMLNVTDRLARVEEHCGIKK